MRLKSCSLWLLVGDKNSVFFHKRCRARISHNHISEINSSDGEVIKGHLKIQQDALSHFQLLFTEEGVPDTTVSAELLYFIPSLIYGDLNANLVKSFS